MTMHEATRVTYTPLAIREHRRWRPVDAHPPAEDQSYTQGALALTFPMASGLDAEPTSAALSVVRALPDVHHRIPDPQGWAARFLQAVLEVVSSDRPITQLARWTDSHVLAEISRRRQRGVVAHPSPTPARTGRQQIATVHISRPRPTVAEIAARVSVGPRSIAMAARLEFHRDRWLCTALDFG